MLPSVSKYKSEVWELAEAGQKKTPLSAAEAI